AEAATGTDTSKIDTSIPGIASVIGWTAAASSRARPDPHHSPVAATGKGDTGGAQRLPARAHAAARGPGGREGSALLGARVDLGDLLVPLVERLGGLPVLDEHALDHLRDDLGVQHLAGRRGRRARVAHGHAGLRHLDEVLERGLPRPEGALEEAL